LTDAAGLAARGQIPKPDKPSLEELMANRNVAHAVRVALIAAGAVSTAAYAPGVLAQDTELEEVVVTGSRVKRIDTALQEQVKAWRLFPVVEALQALRGVQQIVAVTLVTEVGDLTRFDTPRQLMDYLGLVPSEHSTGERRRQGGITKAGNQHARRVLVEGSWAYRYPAKVSPAIRKRMEKVPKSVQDIAWKAQVRLCRRYRHLVGRGKNPNVAVVAVARELAGFLWAIAQEVKIAA